jgi:hypothetical protein
MVVADVVVVSIWSFSDRFKTVEKFRVGLSANPTDSGA